jgi:hypothetical protein
MLDGRSQSVRYYSTVQIGNRIAEVAISRSYVRDHRCFLETHTLTRLTIRVRIMRAPSWQVVWCAWWGGCAAWGAG